MSNCYVCLKGITEAPIQVTDAAAYTVSLCSPVCERVVATCMHEGVLVLDGHDLGYMAAPVATPAPMVSSSCMCSCGGDIMDQGPDGGTCVRCGAWS